MQLLIEALDKKDIPSEELTTINDHIVSINSFGGTDKELTKELKKTYKIILSFIEENLKLVPKNHFRALWIVYGSLAGVVLSSIFANSNALEFTHIECDVCSIIITGRSDTASSIISNGLLLASNKVFIECPKPIIHGRVG